ncbi:MAG: type I restriction endonuclease subunit R, partial [Candidatus Heimdallarchaeaceae archaeon]
ERVKVIDFDNPENNDFLLVSQLWIQGELYLRRPDLIGYVNGIPLIFVELKAVHRNLKHGFDDNLTDYKDTIPHIFWYTGFVILSNGSESKIGTFNSPWEHFNEWKKISDEQEEGVVSLETIIRGTCEKKRFLDILENFIFYFDTGGAPIKILAKYHQYFGVNNALEAYKNRENNKGRLGIFWHTQGAGKSYSMIYFVRKILRKFYGNPTFLIITDRKELDDQIYKNFLNSGAITEVQIHAEDGKHLKQLLRENHRTVFTLIQKFKTESGAPYPKLSDRSDIIIIADEAHRTQYDTLARNMRAALPNAAFIAFTGTPLLVGEEKTKGEFGDYVSIYNFNQSIEDGATLPIFYENRLPEVQIVNPDFDDELYQIIENAMLDPPQEKLLERKLGNQYHIVTRDDRLEKVAEDIVDHFVNRGYLGKAMVVCIDKPTTVKMFDKVKNYWEKHLKQLKSDLKIASDQIEIDGIQSKIDFMNTTDIAVVVSSEQNEIKKFNDLGLDILTHRKRMNEEDLSKKFKDTDDPFRLVFVCAMWLTGFDALALSTLYLDKPLRNHSLMQAIARVNRVFKDKPNGLIIDYFGVFRNLKEALAVYTTDIRDGDIPRRGPTISKDKQIEDLEKEIKKLTEFCNDKGIDIETILIGDKLHLIRYIADSVDLLVANDKTKREYLIQATIVQHLYRAILPDKRSNKFSKIVSLFIVFKSRIYSLDPAVDISKVMDEISKLLDKSIAAEGFIIKALTGDEIQHLVDLKDIDLEELKKKFSLGKKHMEIEKLRNLLKMKLERMIQLNPNRKKYAEIYRELVDRYNEGIYSVDEFFEELMAFIKKLDEEEKRALSENLTDEELTLYDLLLKDGLTDEDKEQVKIAAKDLLDVLKQEKLVLDWKKKQQTKATVRTTIEEVLDKDLPPSYDEKIYDEKCDVVYY